MEIKRITRVEPRVKTVQEFEQVLNSGEYDSLTNFKLNYDVHEPGSPYGYIPAGTACDIVKRFQETPAGWTQNMYRVCSTGQIVNG